MYERTAALRAHDEWGFDDGMYAAANDPYGEFSAPAWEGIVGLLDEPAANERGRARGRARREAPRSCVAFEEGLPAPTLRAIRAVLASGGGVTKHVREEAPVSLRFEFAGAAPIALARLPGTASVGEGAWVWTAETREPDAPQSSEPDGDPQSESSLSGDTEVGDPAGCSLDDEDFEDD